MQLKTLLASLCIVACLSCSKDKLNDHDTIAGTWYIKKIIGLNGFTNSAPLDFASGEYTFKPGGSLEYLYGLRILYKGNWLMYEKPGSSYTDADGNTEWTDEGGTVLELDVDKQRGLRKKRKPTLYISKLLMSIIL